MQFINRFADHINTTFTPDRVHGILDVFQDMFDPEIQRQRKRWPGSAGAYESRIDRMRRFTDRRPGYVRTHIRTKFKLSGDLKVALSVEPAGAGAIKINSKMIEDFPWEGVYFENIPIPVSAVPSSGYRFVAWSDARLGGASRAIINSNMDFNIVAQFEPFVAENAVVVINEINYNSGRDFQAKDWIELHNRSQATLSLAGWSLTDGQPEHDYVFPDNAVIPAHGYSVIARDTRQFNAVYSNVGFVYGNLQFDLSNAGEFVQLEDADGVLIDSLTFDDSPPWPVNADGEGFTLELQSPQLDNNEPEHWSASAVYGGTPGRSNSVVAGVKSIASIQPTAFRLFQNYPNPFNASTIIGYELPQASRVQVAIFDVLGRRVAMLVDSRQEAGAHQINWTADAAGGIYFYRLEANSGAGIFREAKKMVIVR